VTSAKFDRFIQSVLKRKFDLDRCLEHGQDGFGGELVGASSPLTWMAWTVLWLLVLDKLARFTRNGGSASIPEFRTNN
jgi:hypothetical protein